MLCCLSLSLLLCSGQGAVQMQCTNVDREGSGWQCGCAASSLSIIKACKGLSRKRRREKKHEHRSAIALSVAVAVGSPSQRANEREKESATVTAAHSTVYYSVRTTTAIKLCLANSHFIRGCVIKFNCKWKGWPRVGFVGWVVRTLCCRFSEATSDDNSRASHRHRHPHHQMK